MRGSSAIASNLRYIFSEHENIRFVDIEFQQYVEYLAVRYGVHHFLEGSTSNQYHQVGDRSRYYTETQHFVSPLEGPKMKIPEEMFK